MRTKLYHLAQNTYFRKITVSYRFHPLHGQTLPLVQHRKGPPDIFVVQQEGGARAHLPSWMAEETAADFEPTDVPWIAVGHLSKLASLVNSVLTDLRQRSEGAAILSDVDQHGEEYETDQPIRTAADDPSSTTATRGDADTANSSRVSRGHRPTRDPGSRLHRSQ
jgi:hypothetical protein